MGFVRAVPWLLIGVVGACGSFVVSTVLNGIAPDALVVACGAGAVAGVALVVAGSGANAAVLLANRTEALVAVAAGAAAWGVAPLIVMSQRASDAPPGAEVAFFTLSAWGFIALALEQLLSKNRSGTVGASGLVALVGGMIVLASWEFPSSFSPFVRYPDRHLWMLAAGILFAVASWMVVRATRTLGRRPALLASGLGAGVCAVGLAVPGIASVGEALSATAPLLVASALAFALFSASWFALATRRGTASASLVLLLAPPALTVLTAVERLTRVYGPDPVRWSAVIAGGSLVVGAAGLIWAVAARTSRTPDTLVPDGDVPRDARRVVALPAVIALLAIGSLFTPGVRATVEGAFGETYRASWEMLGFETASGWLAVAVAALAVAAYFEMATGRKSSSILAAMAAILAPLAYPFVSATPLRTATRWIPADVQQSYGTEYARLTFEAVHDPVRIASILAAVVVSLVVLAVAVLRRDRGHVEGEA